MTRAVRLEHLRLIRIAGADRNRFLQGQVTQDLRRVTPASSAMFGWTSPQGRLLASGQLFEWLDALWLTVPAATAAALVQRLRLYVLRAKASVELAEAGPLGLFAVTPGALPGGLDLPAAPLACVATGTAFATRVAGDPQRALVVGDIASEVAAAGVDWLLADIRAGLPALGPATSEIFIPQMVNLDLLGGVSFDKGCYTGQEIIARTHHLGRVKRRMFRFASDAGPALEPGSKIYSAGRETGQVVVAAGAGDGQELLAVTQLEDIGGPLFADEQRRYRLRHLALPYRVPEAVEPRPA